TTNTGYSFTGWTGDASGIVNPASLTMSGPRSITATYTTLPVTTIATNPVGLSVVVDGTSYLAPQAFNWTVGSSHTIAVGSLQGSRPTRYAFGGWSDGGAIGHSVTAQGVSQTITATF